MPLIKPHELFSPTGYWSHIAPHRSYKQFAVLMVFIGCFTSCSKDFLQTLQGISLKLSVNLTATGGFFCCQGPGVDCVDKPDTKLQQFFFSCEFLNQAVPWSSWCRRPKVLCARVCCPASIRSKVFPQLEKRSVFFPEQPQWCLSPAADGEAAAS